MVKRKAGSLIVMFLLLICSVCFMALPSYAYSASESASQDVYLSAWIDGESLYILATSTAGIDAVFIDEVRVNYRVDDVLVLSLKEHTDKESLKVYAIDFNGNRSATQTLQNPLYQAPKSSSVTRSTAKPKAPAVSSVPMVASSPTSTPTATETTSTPPLTESTPVTSEASASPASNFEPKPFTPEGNGETLDNATNENGKEFFTITTPDGNVFYLVIDRERGDHDVYFLNAVTENDLLALAEKSESHEETSPPAPSTPEPTASTTSEPEKEETTEKKKGGNNTLLIIIMVLAIGGAIYYVKVLKPKSMAANDFDDDEDFDEEEENYFEEEWDDDSQEQEVQEEWDDDLTEE